MPPKKKPRLTPSAPASSPPAPPLPSAALATSASLVSTPAALPSTPTIPDVNDPWTPEQETSLFKALIRYKPTGIHKHFHMLCISSFLRSHGHCVASDKSQSQVVQHTRIPSIWTKLSSLYDLEALDEREDAYADASPEEESSPSNDGSGENSNTLNSSSGGRQKPPPFTKEFALPTVFPERPPSISSSADDEPNQLALLQHPDALDFTEMVWSRRFHTSSEARSSPPELPSMLERSWRKITSTATSPAASAKRAPVGRTAKIQTPQIASASKRQAKTNQVQATPASAATTRKGRSEIKPDSEGEGESEEQDDDEGGEGSDEEEEEEEEEEDAEDEDEEDEEAKITPVKAAPKTRGVSARGKGSVGRGAKSAATKARGGARGRGRGRGVGKKRG